MGNRPIVSEDRHAWEQQAEHDLVVLDAEKSVDVFSAWISEKVIPAYHGAIGKHHTKRVSWDPGSGITSYSDVALERAISAFATVLSSLFPIMATISLYFVERMGARLGLVAAFTAVFSCCLAFLTNARRVDIFAATTASGLIQERWSNVRN